MKKVIILIVLLLSLGGVFVPSAYATADLPIPRFVTLGTSEVNVRAGPGLRFPIHFVLRKDGLPVEIVREFEVWRKVRDSRGDTGWVHKTMLSGRRSVVVKKTVQIVREKPDQSARPIVKLEPGVIAKLNVCNPSWCRVSVGGYGGWLKRDTVWGIYPDERFEE